MKTEVLIELAAALTGACGVAGREQSAADLARTLLEPLGPVETTALGSVCCTVNAGEPDAPHVLLEAHLDQIGLVVTRVEEDGFLRIGSVGGFDRRTLPAAPVTVHAQGGDFPGVVCSVPPHLAGKDSKPLKIDEFAIDIGLAGEVAKEKIVPGDVVTLHAPMRRLAGDHLAGGAMDDRIGCVAVIAAARAVHKSAPRNRVTVLLSSQEEVGGTGAATGAFALRPDYAVAVDVSFAQGFGAPAHKCGKLGNGTMLGIAPILDNSVTDTLRRLAREREIPFQPEVMGGRTGTDADSIAVSGCGVRTGLLSIPLRNMHTSVETVCCADVNATARLLAAFAEEVVL